MSEKTEYSSSKSKNLITVREAAAISSYAPAYITRLAQAGKLSAVRDGRNWFIDTKSLASYVEEAELKKQSHREKLRAIRMAEIQNRPSAGGEEITVDPATKIFNIEAAVKTFAFTSWLLLFSFVAIGALDDGVAVRAVARGIERANSEFSWKVPSRFETPQNVAMISSINFNVAEVFINDIWCDLKLLLKVSDSCDSISREYASAPFNYESGELEAEPATPVGPSITNNYNYTYNYNNDYSSNDNIQNITYASNPISTTGFVTRNEYYNQVSALLSSIENIGGGGGGSGSVTSVDITGPDFLTVSGGPITRSGTIDLSLADGYLIPTSTTTENLVLLSTAGGNQWVSTSSLGISLPPGSGITSLNGQIGLSQNFATSTAAGIGLNITSSGDVHTFTPTITAGYSIPLTASTTEWSMAYASSTAVTPAYIRGLFSNAATGLTYNASTGALSLTTGYIIPLAASATEWSTAFSWGDHASEGYLTAITGESIEDLQDVASMTQATGDLLYWNGSSWTNISTSSLGIVGGGGGAVDSVNGQTGVVVLDTDDVTEAGNQYFTTARARDSISSVATGLSYATSTGVISLTSGYNIPLNASTTAWTNTNNLVNASSTFWDTAYSWGDHSLSGYLTSIATTTIRNMFSAGTGLSYSTTTGQFTNTGVTSLGGLTGDISTSSLGITFTESDPIFIASDAFSIDNTDITAWNAAAASTTALTPAYIRNLWSETVTGLDYASGVLSLTSGYSIPLTASTTEWSTAYSWGDHSAESYLTTDVDFFITGDGTAGIANATPGVGLGVEVGGNNNAHMEINSPTNGVAYMDFTTVNVDYGMRLGWWDADDLFRFVSTDGVALTVSPLGDLGVIGDLDVDGSATLANATTTNLTVTGDLAVALLDGCVEVSGGLLTSTGSNCGTGSGGINSLNGQTGSSQSFATSTSGGLTLTITSSGGVHTFINSVAAGYSIPLTASTTEWSTAYSWGNHSLAGYLTSETDPIFTASDAFSIDNTDITAWNAAAASTTALTPAYIRSLFTVGTGLSYLNGQFTNTGVTSIGGLTGAVSTSSLGLGDGTFLGLSDTPGSYSAYRIPFTNGAGDALTDSANFTFDSSTNLLGLNGSTTTGFGIGLGTSGAIFASEDVLANGNGITIVGVEHTSLKTGNASVYLEDDAGDTAASMSADEVLIYSHFDDITLSSTNNIILTGVGNVGIGTSTPGSKLTVSGNTWIGGTVTATGAATLSSTLDVTGKTTLGNASTTNLSVSGNSYFGTILSGSWQGSDIDISDYTNLAVSGTGLSLSGDTIELAASYSIPLTASTTEWNNTRTLANLLNSASSSWNAAAASTTALTPAYIRGLWSETVTGLTYNSATGVLSLDGSYNIPLTASTTEWATARGITNLLNSASSTWNNTSSLVSASSTQWQTGYTLATLLNSASSSWNAAAASTTALTPAYLRGLFSNGALGLTYNSTTGATSLTAGYTIPLSASTTEWANKISSQWTPSGSDIYYNTGNVGIGTTTPTASLHVQNNQNAQTGIQIFNNNGSTGSATALELRNGALGTSDRFRFLLGGATFADETVSWVDSAIVTSGSNISGGLVLNATAGGMRFETGGIGLSGQRMVIDNSGNVGIGDTTPASMLTVGNGDLFQVNSSGQVVAGSWLGTVIADDYGGTGQTTYSTGDMLYASGANTLAKRAIGSTGDVLSVVAGVPTWVATSTLGISGGSGSLFTDGGATTYLTSADLLGIGTSTAKSKLAVYGDLFLEGTSRYINFGTAATGTSGYGFRDNNGVLETKNSGGNWLGVVGNNATSSLGSLFVGALAGDSATGAFSSIFLGFNAGGSATDAVSSNFIGFNAGYLATDAVSSNFIGYTAGAFATNATSSNFMGFSAGSSATDAVHSNFIGSNAGYAAADAAYSTFIGYNAGYSDTVVNGGASSSLALGRFAGTGGFSDSIAIGRGVINSAARQLNIGNVLYATGIYNSDSQSATPTSGNIGIGTSTPASKLTVAGDISFTGALRANGNAGTSGMILQTTGSGAAWVATSSLGINSSQWTTSGANIYYNTGNVGIGTSTPGSTLTVAGDISATGIVINASGPAGAIFNSPNANIVAIKTDSGTGVASLRLQTGSESVLLTHTAGYFGIHDGASADAFTVISTTTNRGNVGVGTSTASSKLTVVGTAGSADIFTIASSTGSSFLTVTAAGNVGIGTTTPVANLSVVGSGAGNTPSFVVASSTNTPLLTVLGDGKVGIGVANPTSNLHVVSTSGSGHFTLGYETNDNFWRETIESDGARNVAGFGDDIDLNFDLSSGLDGDFSINTDDFFVDTSNSRIGIGTPSPNQLLTVNGTNPQMSFEESATEFLRMGVGETANTSIIGWDDADALHLGLYSSATDTSIDTKMTIDQSGNVGIGTTTPVTKLDIYTPGSSTGWRHANESVDMRSYVSDAGWIGTHSSHPLKFYVANGGAAFTIATSSNVGIGTTAPTRPLHVAGSINSGGTVLFTNGVAGWLGGSNSSVFASAGTSYLASSAQLGFSVNQTGSGTTDPTSVAMLINGSGNVGIGTSTPEQKLHIMGGTRSSFDGTSYFDLVPVSNSILRFSGTHAINNFQLYDGTNAYLMDLYNGVTNSVRIRSDGISWLTGGNVGIGTTAPGASLEVESASGVGLIVDSNAAGSVALQIDAENTTADAVDISTTATTAYGLDIVASSLTSGGAARFYSNSADTTGRNILYIVNDNAAATGAIGLRVQQDAPTYGVYIDQNADSHALYINSTGTTVDTVLVDASNTTGSGIEVNANSLTSGSIAHFYSNGSNTTARNLVNIINDNTAATGAVTLRVQQDSTADIVNFFDGATEVFTIVDGGNVGIGDSTPTEGKLTVGGTFYVLTNTAVGADPLCWDGAGGSLYGDCTSLSKWKTNVESYEAGLNEILAIESVTFDWKRNADGTLTESNSAAVLDPDTGFIAEQVAGINYNFGRYDKETGELRGINDRSIAGAMVNAIKELNWKIEDLATSTTFADLEEDSFTKKFFGKMIAWFGDTANGISTMIAGTLKAKDELCVGEVCVDESTFLQMVQNAGSAHALEEEPPIEEEEPPVEEVPEEEPLEEEPLIEEEPEEGGEEVEEETPIEEEPEEAPEPEPEAPEAPVEGSEGSEG